MEVMDLTMPQKLIKKHYPKYGIPDQTDYAEAHISWYTYIKVVTSRKR
jgi:hypothetical protein